MTQDRLSSFVELLVYINILLQTSSSSSKILNADVSVSSSANVIKKPIQSTNENESASSTDFLNSFK